ncbi:hypothetical protein ACJ5NV_18290 [Loktanella agnita]|uniref:hypothetical protein n=1 Tax=Loktanella agnita TaxID=287097 RepID=UPI003989FAC2
MKFTYFSAVTLFTAICSHTAYADELRLRGGVASGVGSDYIYSRDRLNGFEDIVADYGLGGMGSASYRMDDLYAGVGLELGVQFGVLAGDDSTTNDDCDAATFLGLNDNCHAQVNTENLTSFAEADALARYTLGNGRTALLGGLSVLTFRNELQVEHLFEGGDEFFIDRDTEFTGLGLKLGARHVVPLQNGMDLNLEAMIGRYRGDRTMQIVENVTELGQPDARFDARFDETIDVTSFELTPSVAIPAQWAGDGAVMEFGVSYKLLQSAVDTRNVVDHEGTDAFEAGKIDDDVSATSVFAGLTIPFK